MEQVTIVLHYPHFVTLLLMEEPAAVRAQAATLKNHLINMACSCPNFVMNVEQSTPYRKQNIVVSVEQKEFNNNTHIIYSEYTTNCTPIFVNVCINEIVSHVILLLQPLPVPIEDFNTPERLFQVTYHLKVFVMHPSAVSACSTHTDNKVWYNHKSL